MGSDYNGDKSDDDDDDDGHQFDPFDFRLKRTKRRQPSEDEKAYYGTSDEDDESKPGRNQKKENKKKKKKQLSSRQKLSAISKSIKTTVNQRVEQDLVVLDDSDEDEDVLPIVPIAAKKTTTIDLVLDSSEDDEKDGCARRTRATRAGNRREQKSYKAVLNARAAAMSLRKAQNYHAEDVCLPSPQAATSTTTTTLPSSPIPTTTSLVDDKTALGSSKKQDLGPSLRVSLRITKVIVKNISSNNNNRRRTRRSNQTSLSTVTQQQTDESRVNLSIRQHEPLQRLLEKLTKTRTNLADSCSIAFSIDGENMDFHKTPEFYDLEDEDLIDVTVKPTL